MKKLEVVKALCVFFALSGAISMIVTWLSTISPWLSLSALVMAVLIMLVIHTIQEGDAE